MEPKKPEDLNHREIWGHLAEYDDAALARWLELPDRCPLAAACIRELLRLRARTFALEPAPAPDPRPWESLTQYDDATLRRWLTLPSLSPFVAACLREALRLRLGSWPEG